MLAAVALAIVPVFVTMWRDHKVREAEIAVARAQELAYSSAYVDDSDELVAA